MNILGVTLTRGGSKGIPLKNIAMCAGRPLIEWTIDIGRHLEKAGLLTQYVVSFDHAAIRDTARQAGALILRQPAAISTDTSTSDEALRWVVEQMEARNNLIYDIIIELMATNPLKTVADAEACMNKLITTGCESVIAVTPLIAHHPSRAKRIVSMDRIETFGIPETSTKRELLEPKAYIRCGAIYAMTRDALFTVGRFGHEDSRAVILPPERGVNIDDYPDLLAAEYYLKRREQQ